MASIEEAACPLMRKANDPRRISSNRIRKAGWNYKVDMYTSANIPEYHRVNEIWHCSILCPTFDGKTRTVQRAIKKSSDPIHRILFARLLGWMDNSHENRTPSLILLLPTSASGDSSHFCIQPKTTTKESFACHRLEIKSGFYWQREPISIHLVINSSSL